MVVGGWYHFEVPDRAAAEALVAALTEFGFAQAGGCPSRRARPVPGMLWHVQVVDEGPYPDSVIGDRQRAAAERQALAIAGAHGGSMTFASTFAADRDVPSLGDADMQVLRLNPGSRPPVVLIRPVPEPPPGQLSLSPDPLARTLIRLDDLGLDAVRWHELTHAYGPADDTPALIAGLAHGHGAWNTDLGQLLSSVLHQGTCYPATAPALTVLSRLLTRGVLPAAKRRDLYLLLLRAAGLYRDDLIELAKYAADGGQAFQPSRWAEQVQDAVGSLTPGLLARWDSEPSFNRLTLAALAAAFPHHGRVLARRIAAMAGEFAGTKVGAYARLAHQLATTDATAALATAAEIATWNRDITAEAVDYESAPPELRAISILSQAVIATAERTRWT